MVCDPIRQRTWAGALVLLEHCFLLVIHIEVGEQCCVLLAFHIWLHEWLHHRWPQL